MHPRNVRSCFLAVAISVLVLGVTSLGVSQTSSQTDALPLVVVVTTGGTIASKIDPATGDVVPALSGSELLEAVPGLADAAHLEMVQFANIDSSKITPHMWRDLSKTVQQQLNRPEVHGVVVTHGTDTMEETAYFLDLTLTSDKPVVLVGAQHNASDPWPDGPANLLGAVLQAAADNTRGLGVTVTMNQYINAARDVRKTHTDNVMTFRSGERGFLGYVDPDGITIFHKIPKRLVLPLPGTLPRVDVFTMYAGADGEMLRAAVDAGAKGLVVAALGIGNVNGPVFDALDYARKKGVHVVIASRCENGRTQAVYGGPGGGRELERIGAVFCNGISPVKARILLMLALAQTQDLDAIRAIFQDNS